MRALLAPIAVLFALSAAQAADDPKLTYSSWTKLCLKGPETNGKQICLTGAEGRLDSGVLAVAAVLVETEGTAKKLLRILVPLGMHLTHGTRVIVDQGTPVSGPYASCSAEGCMAEYAVGADMLRTLRSGKSLVVQAINQTGQPTSLILPLTNFSAAHVGRPADAAAVAEGRRILQAELTRRADVARRALENPSSKSEQPAAALSFAADPSVVLPKLPVQVTEEQAKSLIYSPWVKFCLKNDGTKQVCFTGKDARVESGMPVVAAVLIEPEGETKKIMRVTLPLGVALQPGVRAAIDQGQPATAPYVICFNNGCMADYDADADMIRKLQSGRSLGLQGMNTNHQPIALALPLADFAPAYTGPPTDPKVFEEQQRKLQAELERRAKEAKQKATETSKPPAQPAPAPQVAALPPPAVAVHDRRVALVIGNSDYKAVAALPNPRRDAQAVATALRGVGFRTVTVETDTTRDRLVAALRAFADEADKSDWAVIYFAGHGIELGGVNYLVPVDAKLKADRDVQDETVPLDRVLSSIEGAKKLRLVVLDACRDNPFVAQMRRTVASRSIGRGLARVEPEGGTLVAFAAKQGQIALDGDGRNSPFAASLINRLKTPNLEINKVFRLVRDDVMTATDRKQEPFVYGSLPGEDFFFVQQR